MARTEGSVEGSDGAVVPPSQPGRPGTPARPGDIGTIEEPSPGERIRIFLIDDHNIVRSGMRRVLEDELDIEVVGEASEGGEGLRLLGRHHRADRAIDVLITDLSLPDMSGIEVTRRVKALHPAMRVLIVSMYSDDEYIEGMMTVGADGYLVKHASIEELAIAIRSVAKGEMVVSPIITRRMMAQFRQARARDHFATLLTDRERQVLNLLAEGVTSKQLARRLALSIKTVDNHRARILEKLGASNVAAAVRLAALHGLLDAGDEIPR